jgi:hypothetical protein
MTALSKNRAIVQASSLGTDKHKRRCLRYLGISISKTVMDFENAFEVEKRLKK